MLRRDPLPPVFSSAADLTNVPEGTVGRAKLILKHANAEKLLHCTRYDEG